MHEVVSGSGTASNATVFRPEMAFPYLSEEMIERIRAYAGEQTLASGTVLCSPGDRDVDLFIMLQGSMEVYAYDEVGDRLLLTTIRDRQFSGELDLLSSQSVLVDAVTVTECRVLRVSRADLPRLMRSEGDIANLIMQASIWRRVGLLNRSASGLVLLGMSGEAEMLLLQRFLTRNGYPHRSVEPTDEEMERARGDGSSTQPLIWPAAIFPDGRILRRPSTAALADALGISQMPDPNTTYDVAVVGGGPAGLAAAVYAASEGLSTVIIEGTAPGGQAGTSSKIENYLGFPTGVSGQELANRAQVQALKFGARLALSRDVVAVNQDGGLHQLTLACQTTVCARSVVIATGAQYRKLAVENYERFENQGIYYAATAMEAALCRGKSVVVVGGGNSAGQAAVFLSGIAAHVHLLIRGATLASTMSQYLISRIESSSHITLHAHSEVEHLDGDTALRCATWVNRQTGVAETQPIGGMFIMIGANPNSGWLYGTLALDKKGFVLTGTDQAFENTRYATSVPGIYAVGDVRSDSVKRVASAVGEGSVVITDVHRYLATQRDAAPAAPQSTLAAFQAAAPAVG